MSVMFTDAKSQAQIAKALTVIRTWRCTDMLNMDVKPAGNAIPNGSLIRPRPYIVTQIKKAA